MNTLLIKNATVVTLGTTNRVLHNHSLFVRGPVIEKIAPANTLTLEESTANRVIDAKGTVVMPGFINCHMHFYSTLVRGLGKAKPSKNFVEVLNNLWWRLDRKLTNEDSYYSALIPLIAAIRAGTTTLIDHHASPFAIPNSLHSIAKAVQETGLRASLCYETSDRDGAAVALAGIEENVSFAKECAAQNNDSLRAMFGLHASFTIDDATLEKSVQAAHDLNVGIHVHTAEAASDQDNCQRDHNMRVVERFHKFGVLGEKTICAHGVHLSENELNLLAASKTAVVHNPQSNMNNAVGTANILKMWEKGILVGLGTDAMTVNMREEVRTALWLQKLNAQNPSVGFCEVLATLLENNATIARRQWKNLSLGELREGGIADIVLLDYQAPTPFSNDTFLGHFAFGITQSTVRTTIASGKVLMHNFQLEIPVDEESISARSQELAQALWQRF
jgi:putative selenium metabolism protein SsnA